MALEEGNHRLVALSQDHLIWFQNFKHAIRLIG